MPHEISVRLHLRDLLDDHVEHPIGRRRAYTEIVLVYLAFFGRGIVDSVESLAGKFVVPKTTWQSAVDGTISTLTMAALAVTLVVVLCARRHRSAIDLGLSLQPLSSPSLPGLSAKSARWQWLMAVWVAASGLFLFGVAGFLDTGHYHFGTHSGAHLVEQLAQSVNAGVVEETVVLAFVMVTLAQARRPVWEIATWALVLRSLYHLYYGPGALGVVLWVPIVMWVFWATKSLFPVIVAHVLFDSLGFLAKWSSFPAVAVVEFVGGVFILASPLVAILCVLAQALAKPAAPAPAESPP